jgi:hypothetical protein
MKKTSYSLFLALFMVILAVSFVYAQTDNNEFGEVSKKENVSTNGVNQPLNPQLKEIKSPMDLLSYNLSLIVLAFGALIIGLETFIIFKKKLGAEYIVRFITVTLIITSTLFLITAGYDNNQIAPAMGLLGTIAGYLLGKDSTEKEDKEKDKKKENEAETKTE